MSDPSPEADALLKRARELLEPDAEQLAAVRGALARKLEAGAAPSCGEAEALGRSGLAPRGLWTLGGKLGLAAGLTLLAGAGVLLLRPAPRAAVPSAAAPPPAAHAFGPVIAAEAPAVSVMDRAATSSAPQAAAPEPPAEIAARPAGKGGRPLARAASARGARSAPAAQPARATEPAGSSAVASRAAAPLLAADSGGEQDAVAARTAVTPAATPAAEGARVALEPDRLAREVAMIEGARAGLERGDDVRALQILDAHGREFPAGTLREEQLALRARALCALGRIDEGRRDVLRLAARAPESPHLKRSRAACGLEE